MRRLRLRGADAAALWHDHLRAGGEAGRRRKCGVSVTCTFGGPLLNVRKRVQWERAASRLSRHGDRRAGQQHVASHDGDDKRWRHVSRVGGDMPKRAVHRASTTSTIAVAGSAFSFRITCATDIRPRHVCDELDNGDEQRPMPMRLCVAGRGQRAGGSSQLRVMRTRPLTAECLPPPSLLLLGCSVQSVSLTHYSCFSCLSLTK